MRGRVPFQLRHLLGAFALCLALATPAQATTLTGVADENLEAWSSPSWAAFNAIGVKQVRHIVPWDTIYRQGPREEAENWVAAAEAHSLKVLISFNHNEQNLPSPQEYLAAVAKFRENPAFDQITEYTAWNEPNHHLSKWPNANPDENPELAGAYWVNLNFVCHQPQYGPACTVVAGDFLDPSPASNGEGLKSYLTAYKAQIAKSSVSPSLWAIHPYSAAETNDWTKVKSKFLDLTSGDVWFTEVGGMVCRPPDETGGPTASEGLTSEQFQKRSVERLLAYANSRVKRTYYYALSAPGGGSFPCEGVGKKADGTPKLNRFDSSLLSSDQPRPAFQVAFPAAANPPSVQTAAATSLSTTQATLNGSLDPRGFHTSYHFEWGTTTNYTNSVPVPDAYAGFSGSIPESAGIGGLQPGTTYHYRLVASNPFGVTAGGDQSFTTPSAPESDVNGDHKSDLVTLHTSGNVYTYMGQASGDFGSYTSAFSGSADPAQFDGTGYYPIDVTEVNGDSYDDLVAVDQYGTVATSLGQAGGYLSAWVYSLNGTITPAILNPSPGKYEPIAVADVTGDGRGDFVAYNNVDKTIYTFPGTSTGAFSAAKVASLPGAADSATFDSVGEYFVDVADVTGDGRGDLVAQATNGYGKVYPGLASGTGGFQASAVLSFSGTMTPAMATGSGWDPLGIADVNGDGFADFVAHHSSGNIYTYLGKADGTFAGGTASSFEGTANSNLFDGTGQEFASLLDVNGDGFADLLSAAGGNVYVFPGQPGGYFGAAKSNFGGTFVSTRTNHSSGWQIVMEKPIRKRNGCEVNGCGVRPESDVNGDHKSDLVTLHTSGNVYTYMGQASGDFGSYTSAFSGSADPAQFDGTGYYPIDVTEVNGDSYDDLVAVDQYGTVATSLGQAGGYLSAWVYSLNGTITPAILNPSPGKYEPIAVADVTGDGRGDFVAYNNVDKTIYTFPGTSTGAFSAAKVASLPGAADSATFDSVGEYFVDVADVTGDGRGDLVAQATNGYGKVYPGLASGTGGFQASAVLSFSGTMTPAMATGSGWDPLGIADVNGDGFADFVAHHSSGNIYTYLGKADGTFAGGTASSFEGTANSNLFDGTGQEFASLLDVNGDGFADLLSAAGGNVYVFPGQPGGYFGAAKSNFGGTFVSTRTNHSSGWQIVMEKPIRKRNGCEVNGCH